MKTHALFHPNSDEMCIDCQIGQLSCWDENEGLDFTHKKVLESLLTYRATHIEKILCTAN